MAEQEINGHKAMAMGLEYPSGDFGVEKLGSGAVNGSGGGPEKHMKDSERNAPVGSNQANPDHGWK